MRLNKIEIQNFRCFKNFELNFGEGATIFIGKNGTGKTTLLHVLKIGLSFIFSKQKMNGFELLANIPTLHVENISQTDANFEEPIYPIALNFFATLNFELSQNDFCTSKTIAWSCRKNTPAGKLLSSQFKTAFEEFIKNYNQDKENVSLPVLAYFSDSYPHKLMNSSNFSKKILKEGRSLPRTFAYYGWSAENNCADIWQDRLIDQLLISKTKDYSESKEVDYVKSKLKTFTEPLEENYPNDNTEFVIKDVNVRGPRGGLYLLIEFKDDRKMRFDQLPQGFNRTLSIVLDLAYRSYVLNKNIDSTGVVIIDEIELHLHPSLQKEILTRLQKTFPMLQFIVTTHSPLVLSNIKADGIKNKIISLENKGNNYFSQEVEDNYGVNYSTSLQETMGTRYRHSTIDKLIDSYVYLNQKGQTENAQKMYQKLIDFLGGNISNELKKEIEEKIKSKSL